MQEGPNPVFVFLLLVSVVVYFVPWIVAWARQHHQVAAIFVLNLFLGWTFIGWVVALAMAASAVRPRDERGQAP